MIARRAAMLALLFLVFAGGAVWALQGAAQRFPHRDHADLFPVCEGCHAGVVSGKAGEVFPTVQDCERCHDGRRAPRITWSAPTPRVSLLRFSHVEHALSTKGTADSTTCLTCHAASDPPRRMVVAGPNPERCVRCHANASKTHLATTARCRDCHVAVADAPRLTTERLARFPKPAWHDEAAFASEHGRTSGGQAASCAVCHARESCERCHANADRLSRITTLKRDARLAELATGRPASYFTPRSHEDQGWRLGHAATASSATASCANCHTQPSCDACHAGGSGPSRRAIAALPGAGVRAGLGVNPARIDRSVHPENIVARHGTLAASGAMTCAACHSEQTCAGCHAAPESRRFHAANFVERHAVDVFASGADCQSCHSTERFCRDCHARVGIAADARMSAAFHTGKANWVLSHGQAARTGMESCASCHRQNDCVRCHSARGGWGVNPHRDGYAGGTVAARNSASCRWCHLGPVSGGGP